MPTRKSTAKLVTRDADGRPRCGYSPTVGYPDPVDPALWWCHLCAADANAALDQELAAAEEAAQPRSEADD
jgi:hypothetical protein